MTFFDWITRRPGFRTLEDSFAFNRTTMLAGLKQAIALQRERCDEVWLVAHFFDTFVWLQNFLGREAIDYSIVDHPIDRPGGAKSDTTGLADVRLTLASMIQGKAAEPTRTSTQSLTLAIIACERHPLADHDTRLKNAARDVDAAVTLGYVLSLDDAVVQRVVSPMAFEVLKQMGLDEHELIASHHLSRQLERRLRRDAAGYSGDQQAESAAEWIALNSA